MPDGDNADIAMRQFRRQVMSANIIPEVREFVVLGMALSLEWFWRGRSFAVLWWLYVGDMAVC